MAIVDKSLFRPTPVLRPRRRKLLARVVLTQADGVERAVVVENVSASGIQASCGEGAPAVGTQVTLALPDVAPLWGVVRWVDGLRFGVEVESRAATSGKAGSKDRHDHAATPPGALTRPD